MSNNTSPIQRLRQVPLTDVWPKEAVDFTPWLLANPDVLSESLGLEIEFIGREHPVGSFALDILGQDLTNQCTLIVENQLTVSDHSHLGQLLTYAGGTEAETIVWIAERFRDEHRNAIDYLNGTTVEGIRFFAIEVGAVRIGDSPAAPVFTLVSQPNNWAKQVRAQTAAAELVGRPALYHQFWGRMLEALDATLPQWTYTRTPSTVNWIGLKWIASAGIVCTTFRSDGNIEVQFNADKADGIRNRTIMQTAREAHLAISDALGEDPVWDFADPDERKSQRVAIRRPGKIENEESWDEYIAWFVERLPVFFEAIEPHIQRAVTSPG